MGKKLVTTWEKEKGYIIINPKIDLESKMDEAEYDELTKDPNNARGIHWADRTAFLKDNGYEITRENLVDVDLRPNPQNEAEAEGS